VALKQARRGFEAHLENLRKRLMREALDRCAGGQMRAGSLVGMSFRSFRYYAKKYELARGLGEKESRGDRGESRASLSRRQRHPELIRRGGK
jgi:hypothetical protein